jgi:hypothetical protein
MPGRDRGARALHKAILRVASWLVPHHRRGEWLEEWTTELWYLVNGGSLADDGTQRTTAGATLFCLGAFNDAVWIRIQSVRVQVEELARLQNPIHCVTVLAMITAVGLFFAWALPAVRDSVLKQPILAHLLMLILALLMLPIMAGLAPGLHPAGADRSSAMLRLRCWTFLGIKLGLLAAAVFLGTFALDPLISRSGLQPQSVLVGYVLAFRWALNDQRRRCPRCFRLLTDPVRIGHSAGTLLNWYGIELVCARGHGVLHVPELARSSYCASRWVALDASWQELFPPRC